jgi:hypothetical protein
MADWLPALAAAGKWVLGVAVSVFVLTMMALVIYVLRKGEPSGTDVAPTIQPFGPYSPTGRRAITAYKGVRKLRVLASRETYVSMETLLSGTATRAQWALFTGIQVCLASFWLIFVGIGLLWAPSTEGWSLFLPAVSSLWFLGILKTVWDDVVAARKKLAKGTSESQLSA